MLLNFKKIRNSRILRWQSVSEAALMLTIITFLSKIIGYLRTVLVAYYFGATAQVDAFVVAMLIPSMILGIISGGLQTVIIPVYTEEKHKNLIKAKIFVNQIFFINLVILAAISVLMFLFPTVFVKIVAYGFKGQRLSLAAHFMRYLVIFGLLNVFVGLFVGILQAEKQFLFPAITMLIANTLIPLSLFIFAPKIGINSWTIGEISFGVFGFSVMFLFLFYKKQFFHGFQIFRINWQKMWQFFILLLPIILTAGVGTLYQIVDKTVASSLPAGSVAALNFAQLIYKVPLGLLITPLVVSVYPSFSNFAAKKDKTGYSKMFQNTFFVLTFLIIPILFIFIVYAQPIVRLLYQHGAFTTTSTSLTAFAVSMYSIGLFTISANALFQKVFFSFKDTKTPLYITTAVVIFNAIGDVFLSKIWGVGGIGLATALATILAFFLYAFMIRKRHFISIPYRSLIKEGLKVVLSSIVTLTIALLFKNYINVSPNFVVLLARFTLVALILAVVYLFSAYLLRSYGFNIFVQYSKKYLKKFG
jgi:putative peptidoglycan lipid II flippase